MSKYGYNPDEHVQTKVTLIDKDGFYKESDEVPGGEGLNEGIKIYKDNADNLIQNSFYVSVIVDMSKRPDIYNKGFSNAVASLSPIEYYIYVGKKIDESNFRIEEMVDKVSGLLIPDYRCGESSISEYLNRNNITYLNDFVITIINNDFIQYGSLISIINEYYDTFTDMQNGTPLHFVLATNDGFVFMDGVWNLEE